MGQVRPLYQWVTVLWLRATNIIEGYNVAAAQLKVTVQFRAMLLQHVKIAYIGVLETNYCGMPRLALHSSPYLS